MLLGVALSGAAGSAEEVVGLPEMFVGATMLDGPVGPVRYSVCLRNPLPAAGSAVLVLKYGKIAYPVTETLSRRRPGPQRPF